MSQRMMLIVSAVVTAFLLVAVGAVAGRVAQGGSPAASPAAAAPTSADPPPAASGGQREAAYQAALAEANRRLELANAQLAQQSPAAAAPAPATGYAVSAEQAQAIALAALPGAALARGPELVRYEGAPAYEVLLDSGTLYVDAMSGAVLAGTAAGGPVSAEQAAQIAQAYRGGGELREVEREREHGADVYEVQFADGGEVYVDAASGQVVYAQLGDDEHDEGEHDD